MSARGREKDTDLFDDVVKKARPRRKRRLILLVPVLAAAFALLMPVSNLIFKPQRPPIPQAKLADPMFAKAGPLMQHKCVDCHSTHTKRPWYFSLPVAKKMINKDVADGIEAFDLTDALFGDAAFSQVQLARIEYVLYAGTMPPMRYVAMHWDSTLSPDDTKNIQAWIGDVRKNKFASPDVAPEFAGEPVQPLPMTVDVNEAKVMLGDKLFHDKRLSADDTLACAGCHGLDKGGTDQDQFATGIKGQLGPINAPTVYNSSYNLAQFWDGRAADLFEQADGPVNNPKEMGSNWDQVIGKIKDDPYYKEAFPKLYADGMTEKNIRDAIATFEKTLITPNSPFDRYLKGEKEAISAQQLAGYKTFVTTGCASCHMGPALGGLEYQKMGARADYFAARGTDVLEADLGRYNVTKKEKDRFYFKVPILRNIEVTHPYFHDGTVKELPEAIKKMGLYQLNIQLTPTQISNIEQFLDALTGQYKAVPLTEVKAPE